MPSASDRAAAAAEFLARVARVMRPWLQRGATMALTGLTMLLRGLYRRRALGWTLLGRLSWWGSLLLLVVGGGPLLRPGTLPDRQTAIAPFVAGLAICAVLRLCVAHRHVRVAALVLGAMHGAALVLVWTAFGG